MNQQFIHKMAILIFCFGTIIVTVYFVAGIYTKRKKHDNQKALDYFEYSLYTFVAILALYFFFLIC